jgi:hypothetical protein
MGFRSPVALGPGVLSELSGAAPARRARAAQLDRGSRHGEDRQAARSSAASKAAVAGGSGGAP